MGHHGTQAPYSEMNEEQMKKIMEGFKEKIPQLNMADQLNLGPTGKFPMGHLNQDDEGEIRIGITSSNGKVVIDFGKPIHWIGFSPEQAKQIAETLIARADGILGTTESKEGEMPQYKSHKKVRAVKIKEIVFDIDLAKGDNRETDGSATITPEEDGCLPFKVDHAYVSKHKPQAGGYFVVYDDGYKSWSPAKAFEEGYIRL